MISSAKLFERHHRALWRLALRMSGDPETAHDLVQETFVRVMSRTLPDEPASAEAWMMRTLVNLCRDLHRWRQVRRTHQGALEAASARREAAVDPESRAVARATVEKGLQALSPRRRAVLVLHDLEGLTPARVAEVLALRPPTVRWHLAAARRELRAAIEESTA